MPQTVLFPDLFDKPLFAKFNQEQASSDGGAVLLKAAERVYGLVKAFARCLSDKRAPEKIRHTLADLIGQRIFGIACGHPDCNDAEHLADDPIHKLLLGRDPVAGESLASQPTLSRFENAAGRGALYDMGCELAARVVERHRRRLGRVRRITIDLDPTDDPTHGAQQYSLFNGYYDNWCYLPLLAFLTFDREPEQYLCSAVLRHGKAVASEGGVALLARLLPLLRCAFPRARFLVRLDGGFASPALFDFLGAQPRLDYVVAMASNAVLLRHAEPAMLVARARSEQTEHLYMDTIPVRKRRLRAGRHLPDIPRSGEVAFVLGEDGPHRPMHNPLDHALALLLDGRLRLLVQRVEQLEEVVPPLVRPRRLDGDGLQGQLCRQSAQDRGGEHTPEKLVGGRPITTLQVADPNTVEIGSHPAQARGLRDGDLHPHHHSSPSARSDAE